MMFTRKKPHGGTAYDFGICFCADLISARFSQAVLSKTKRQIVKLTTSGSASLGAPTVTHVASAIILRSQG